LLEQMEKIFWYLLHPLVLKSCLNPKNGMGMGPFILKVNTLHNFTRFMAIFRQQSMIKLSIKFG